MIYLSPIDARGCRQKANGDPCNKPKARAREVPFRRRMERRQCTGRASASMERRTGLEQLLVRCESVVEIAAQTPFNDQFPIVI